ncbi:MAG: hypothetical protein L6E13_11905 [Firmicutes bacterium]|nr:hypothetical protein [Bacillota bacterium]
MPFSVESIQTPSPAGIPIVHDWWRQDPPASRLMVLLPGRNYSCDRPVLHFLRAVGLELGYDVLCLKYSFQVTGITPPEERWREELAAEVQAALRQVLGQGYREICWVGKSLGSPLAVELSRTVPAERTCAILLTPLEPAMAEMGAVPTLAVIGTADPLYGTAAFAASQGRPGVEWRVFPDLDHGLEVKGDWRRSLAALSDVVSACAEFLARAGGPPG